MQLGTRWGVSATPPTGLPENFLEAIAEVEAELVETDTGQWRWTLTWLERRPVAELDDGTTLRVAHDGAIIRTDDNTPS